MLGEMCQRSSPARSRCGNGFNRCREQPALSGGREGAHTAGCRPGLDLRKPPHCATLPNASNRRHSKYPSTRRSMKHGLSTQGSNR